jgi:hypothetical protein
MSNRYLKVSDAKVVEALANLASRGTYNNVTPAIAKEMNELFEAVAQLINKLESQNDSTI